MRANDFRRLLLLSTVVATSLSSAAYAQLESIERKGAGSAVPAPSQRRVVPPPANIGVDPSGVWYHIRQKNMGAARAELARLKEENPGWQVPSDLQDAIEGRVAPAASVPTAPPTVDLYARSIDRAEAAIRQGKTASPDDLAVPMQRRKDSGAAERIGRALFDMKAVPASRSWFDRATQWAKAGSDQQTAAVIGLVKVDTALGNWDAAQQSLMRLPEGAARKQVAQILSDAATAAAESKARAGDWNSAEQLAKIAETTGQTRIRIDIGWAALDASDGQRAAASFAAAPQTEESKYGRILALTQANADLTQACGAKDRSERQTTACGDAYAARALTAYNAQQWNDVIALDASAVTLGVQRPGTQVLAGWSHYRQKNYKQALQAFDAAASEGDAADGIAQTLIAEGDYNTLKERAANNPRLMAAYRKEVGPLAVIRQRTLLAHSLDMPETEGVASPAFTTGVYARDKTGASGADRMSVSGANANISAAFGTQRLSLTVETDRIRTGTPRLFGAIGALVTPTPSVNHVATLTTPTFVWSTESVNSAYSVTLGATPLGGVLNAVPVGALTLEHDWDKIIATATVRAAPRYDSLLSMAGLRDGSTNTTWGRVVEFGPQIGVIALLGEQISASVSGAVTALRGHGVINNDHVAASASLTYEVRAEGFDYIRVGPSYSFDHYRRDENFFTVGNGGYYSPDAAHSIGGFVDFLTHQGRSWLLGIRATAAYQHSSESGAPRFPLADDGSRFLSVVQSQFGTDSTLRGAVLLGSHFVLGGYGRVTYSPSGRDMAAGLTLSIPFGGRTGLFAGDLPHFADRSWP